MGRPDPCILFAQSFVHSQLDEYVDEVLFNEPVVITACEILEQNASPSGSGLSLLGATTPPSFALEVFVHCEGESRFRRLCPAFLYSHASSNVLEVEAVITSHLVIRGSYRSLTLVIYGNTAEDLGQFNIEFDLDSSLANLVSSPSEGKLLDLPTAFCSSYLRFEETITSFKLLSHFCFDSDLPSEMKDFILLLLKKCEVSNYDQRIYEVVNSVISAVSSYVSCTTSSLIIDKQCNKKARLMQGKNRKQVLNALVGAKNELLELHNLATNSEVPGPLQAGTTFQSNAEFMTSKFLVEMYSQCFPVNKRIPDFLPQTEVAIQLGVAILLCSTSESCYQFANIDGFRQIIDMLSGEIHKSPAVLLLLLVSIEHATRHSIGCEGFLGWWPRDYESVPIGSSEGYSKLLSLLLQTQRHDVASLTTLVLHRLRFYEIASKYESSVLFVLGNISGDCHMSPDKSSALLGIADLLKKLLKLLKFQCFMEDLFGSEFHRRPNFDQADGLLSYKATISYIINSKCNFATKDIDADLLCLLKERGFLPLSAALLSCSPLRSDDVTMDIFMEIAASIQLILFSFLQCRTGLTFLLLQPEATTTLILSLKGVEDLNKSGCLTLRHAAILISKGFFCRPEEVSIIIELHLRVVHLIDRLLSSTIHSEEQFLILWDLCAISRSDSGRQALLLVGLFPEAISILLECLRTFKDSEIVSNLDFAGHSPSSVVIFHCVAEIFEALVTDSAASSQCCWIEHAMDLHKALHSSSPGSNRKDAPTRLLEWIDAGVVYNKNGATGLLRYAAVLASGGDAHLSSASVLVSDSMDVENVVGESVSCPDSQIVDNLLGKFVSDKHFDGLDLRTTSLVQLTTALRILAFVSENSAVASALYEEGAVTLIYVILVNSKYMLERSSNSYGYLVDEGAECTSTSDLLLERHAEDSLINVLVPSLLFLLNILQQIQDAKEQYRNTKLLNALLKLHREVSPKVIACATEISLPFSASALGLHVVCRLIVSALASWPIFGWAPGLFHCLFESVQATPLLTVGPKDVCSIFSLLGDLLPVEDIWIWRNGVPALSALRSVSVGTILDSQAEYYIDWYLKPEYQTALLVRLTQQSEKIAQIVLTFSCTVLDILQDMIRVLVVRIACQKTEFASNLLRPIISWIYTQIDDISPSEINVLKVHGYLTFISSLCEHSHCQVLLLKEGILAMFGKVLERCMETLSFDGKPIFDKIQGGSASSTQSWILPSLKSLSFLFEFQSPLAHSFPLNEHAIKNIGPDICSSILLKLIKLCQKSNDAAIIEEKLTDVTELIDLLKQKGGCDDISAFQCKDNAADKVVESAESLFLQLQNFGQFGEVDADTGVDSAFVRSRSMIMSSQIWKSTGHAEKSEDLFFGSLSEAFMWDCPDSPPDKVLVSSLALKRKHSSTETSSRRARENPGSETVASNVFTRGMTTASISSGPSRRDTFRQRKPNTSRPPSMHVDDYVARERNIDGVSSSSNIIGPSQRGLTSGRPPSIHVDEFMARQRERQSSLVAVVGENLQVFSAPPENGGMLEKSDSSRKLRADLDDDHEINIVFDEESESDDRLPFPQLDDSLPNPLVRGESPSASVVEESEGDLSGGSSAAFPSRTSVPQSESMPTKEVHISLENDHVKTDIKKSFFREKSGDWKVSSPFNVSKGIDAKPHTLSMGCTSNLHGPVPSPAQHSSDVRLTPVRFPVSDTLQKALSSAPAVSRGYYEKKVSANQPPPPPMPPPNISSLVRNSEPGQNLSTPYSQATRDLPPLPSGFPQQPYDVFSNAAIQAETVTAAGTSYSATLTASQTVMDSKFSWSTAPVGNQTHDHFISGNTLRPPPPLPPTPPPFTSSSMAQSMAANSGSQSSFSNTYPHLASNTFNEARVGLFSPGIPSFTPNPFVSPLIIARPPPSPSLHGSPTQSQNIPTLLTPMLNPLNSLQSIQTRAPPPPPPPPQLPRLPHPQHVRPPPQCPQVQKEHITSSQKNPIQVQQIQVPQQLQAPHIQVYYQTQQENVPRLVQPVLDQGQSTNLQMQTDNTTQQTQDSGMTLQQYFSSPEAIQSLLSDRDKLCQLLEQHPKLMQMLQERLGQL